MTSSTPRESIQQREKKAQEMGIQRQMTAKNGNPDDFLYHFFMSM